MLNESNNRDPGPAAPAITPELVREIADLVIEMMRRELKRDHERKRPEYRVNPKRTRRR